MDQNLDCIIAEFLGIPLSIIRSIGGELHSQLRAAAANENYMQLHQLGYAVHLQLIQINKEGGY